MVSLVYQLRTYWHTASKVET